VDTELTLADEVESTIGKVLRDRGFVIVEQPSSADSFGNAVLVVESPDLRLRFVRDRGQTFSDIGAPREENMWWDLDAVAMGLGLAVERDLDGSPVHEIRSVGRLLVDSFAKVCDAFSATQLEKTKQGLEWVQRARAKRLFGRPDN
jgi:hypothetical protein